MAHIATALAAFGLCVPLNAQWLNYRTPGIPRTVDGKPNLSAPAPRRSDGKPDLSGLWEHLHSRDSAYYLKGIDFPWQPSAKALLEERKANNQKDNPEALCLPRGLPKADAFDIHKIVQTAGLIAILYEYGTTFRQIFTDGRALPKDPNPTWMGYSVGHWEGDTLVVESAGFNDRTWLDRVGHLHSEELHVTETYRRVDFGHMQYQTTYRDPKMLTKPLSISLTVNYAPDTDMLETVCNENERDTAHLAGKANGGVHVSKAVLEKYTGRYEFTQGAPAAGSFFPRTPVVTLVNGQLYLNDLPLIPQTETRFDSTAATIEFVSDAKGAVTHFILNAAEGDSRF